MISYSTATRARSAAGRPVTALVDGCAEVGRHVVFAFRAIAGIPTALHRYFSHVLRHIGEVSFGYASLLAGGGTIGIVLAMSAVAAMMVGVETQRGLELIGMTSLSGMLSAIANTRELAPVVASIALAAKVGTGFTAQLGAMRISDEIDALDAMAVKSVPFLASTRLIAAAVCVIPIYMVGLLGSYVATRLVIVNFQGNSAGTYDYYFHLALSPTDLWYSLTKAVVFAIIVAIVHCSYGFYASGGPEGVGRAAGRALRTSILAIGITDVVLTFALWGLVPTIPGVGLS
ncbi:phospholipid/cholesterol/gamma-HCH transport system permease protein [Rhodococcus sp. SMB37]|uniref:MlaE family ABC transporter permease n=1 Tax=Rhodococcus sp. SMB37 TaxID=2512213 RepID=UPI00104EC3FE|nr:ABC transporter permease [Rhodococcus sp. SMB37]TCN49016.1 phospholipid/cholesterol/gamma-HCH transport system permease protein [Rhodococcus sp. SMB37]